VIISKRGDIIPKLERVVENPVDSEDIVIPTTCSTCQTPLLNEGTRLYCPNEKCSKHDYARLLKWIQKLEVKNFGELILKQLFDKGRVKKIVDLYTLTLKDLTRLERVQERSAQKALDNLFAVSEISLAKFIGGFNLENVGERMVQKVVDAGFDMLEKLHKATPSDFARVEGFGSITGQWLYEGMQSLYFDMLDVLNQNKITIRRREMGSKKLDGLSFCFTGKLESMTRKEAQELVTEHGGTSKSGVSSTLSYLVTNSTESTAKFTKAQQLGVKVITEDEFLAMIK
jgi:DNA ligase (NAD+)